MAISHTYLVTITHKGCDYQSLELRTTKGAALTNALAGKDELAEAVRSGEASYRVERLD